MYVFAVCIRFTPGKGKRGPKLRHDGYDDNISKDWLNDCSVIKNAVMSVKVYIGKDSVT